MRLPARQLLLSFAQPLPPRSLVHVTRYSQKLSVAVPDTEIDVDEVVAGAAVTTMAGGVVSKSRHCRRRDSSTTRSSVPSVAGPSNTGTESSVAEAAVAVDSSLAPPQPARIIEAMA
jgi:hypothetical protein